MFEVDVQPMAFDWLGVGAPGRDVLGWRPVGDPVKARPVVVQSIHGYVDLYVFDLVTGKPLARYETTHYQGEPQKPDWMMPADGADGCAEDCLCIDEVYGEDDAAFVSAANERLAEYGLRLGEYVEQPAVFHADPEHPKDARTILSDYYLLELA